MSQPEGLQSKAIGRTGSDSERTPNGIESTEAESTRIAHIDTAHFGLFHDQIRDEVKKLKESVSVANTAVTELSKTFLKYGTIVNTVGERYDKDQVLEKEIRDLTAANARIWKNITQDRDSYKKEISDLKRKHEKGISTLQGQAEAGEKEKKKYEEMERRLKDQHDKARQTMEEELKQKKIQLDNENAEKIAGLEREKKELESSKARLELELNERTRERDREKDIRETMHNKAQTNIKELERTLAETRDKYRMVRQPLQFYEDRYKALIEHVGQIATLYFEDLPEKAIDNPVGTSDRLSRKAPSFARVPIAMTECSQTLRLANAQHIIFEAISGSVWHSFFSPYLWKHKRNNSSLSEMYLCLADDGEDFQHSWKVSTLKALDKLDDKVDVEELVDNVIDQAVITALQPLLDDGRVDQFKDDLKAVFVEAIDLGRIAQRDDSPVYFEKTPSLNDSAGWKEYSSEDYAISDAASLSPTSPTSDIPLGPLYVSPKIFRKGERVNPTATATTSVTAPAGRSEVEVIQPGVALFPGTGIFHAGAMDWQRIHGAGRELAKNINGKGRRTSLSTSGTGLGIVPRSPQEASKRWSRQGTREFD